MKRWVPHADTGPVSLRPSLVGRSGWSRVLVIDDDPDVGRLVRLILELEGHEVVLTDDGLRGLAAAQHQRPDAIVLDLMMPVMDGYEVLKQLQADPRTCDVPVVVLSAVTLRETRERVEGAGAVAFIAKPFDADQLSRAVASVIQRPTMSDSRTGSVSWAR